MQPIILLHGALGTAQSMAPLAQALSGEAEVHLMDFSGHGAASWPEGGFSMDVFEQDLVRFISDRGLDAVHLFGYSMGGFVALRLARSMPERVRSVSTLATKLDWTEETCAREARMLDPDTLEAKAPKFTAALAQTHTKHGWRRVMDETRTMLEGMHRYRLSPEELSAIGTPVRLMLGDRDKMVRLDETLEAFRSLPDAQLAVLPGTPHPLESADTALLAAHIGGFIWGK